MVDISIINSKVVNEGEIHEVDLYIKNGRIEKISTSLEPKGEVIDASGLLLLPGVIDDQVHFREPGLTHKGSILSESRAAIAGGTTSFMDMPNVIPPTLNEVLWEDKNEIASSGSLANYSFYMGASNDNIEIIKSIDPNKICGVKVFMGSSTGDLLVDNKRSLENIFKESKVIITTHCEDTPIISKNEEIFREKYGENVPFLEHSNIRSRESSQTDSSDHLQVFQLLTYQQGRVERFCSKIKSKKNIIIAGANSFDPTSTVAGVNIKTSNVHKKIILRVPEKNLDNR